MKQLNIKKCVALNFYYNNKEKNKNINIPNKHKIKAIEKALSNFSENDADNFKNYLFYIIKEEKRDTLNYSSIDNEIIPKFEKKRNLILKTLILYSDNKIENFDDNMIFRMMNIIDRFIFDNFNSLNEQQIKIIIQSTFKLLSKIDNYLIQIDNNEVKNTEIDIMKKLNFNFNFITNSDILNFAWKIITLNENKNDTFYLSLMILIISLHFIEMLKYDKISLVISSLFYSSDITGYDINRSRALTLFQYNKTKINAIKIEIENMLKNVVNNKTYNYLFEKFEDRNYMEITKKYFKENE